MKHMRFDIFILVAVMVATQYSCFSASTQKQAEQFIQEKNYQGAIDVYQAVIASKPDGPEGHQAKLDVAKLYIEKMNRPEQGVKLYQDLIATAPDSKETAQAHWQLGIYHFTAKNYQSAQESFDTIINKFPNLELSHNAQLMLAKSHEKAESYERAAEIYDNVANRHPKSKRAAQALTNKARIQMKYLKDETEAKRTYQSLVKRYGKVEGTGEAISEAKRELELMGATVPEPEDPEATKYGRQLARRMERQERTRSRADIKQNPAMSNSSVVASAGFGVSADQVMQSFDFSMDEQGTYHDAMLTIAKFSFDAGEYRDAGALYFQGIELAKREGAKIDAYNYLNLSICYRKLGMHQRAAEVLKESVKRDRHVIEAVIGTGTNQYTDGDYEKAIETFKSIAGLNRTRDPEIYWKLGKTYEKMGEPKKECEYFERAIAAKTDDKDALQSLAEVLYYRLQDKERAGIFQDLVDARGDTYAGEKELGAICYKYGNYIRAKSKFKVAANIAQRHKKDATSTVEKRVLDNQLVYARAHAAMATYKTGAEDQAQEVIDTLAAEYPEHPLIPYGRGQLALLKGDAETAIAAFKTSMEKHPHSDAAPIALGEHYISQGHADEAIALWDKFLKTSPDNRGVYRRLNELKKRIKVSTTSDPASE